MSVVMGTAGHVDHGKTALVRALTGIDCDRLLEEKRRGITIELGFAYCDVADVGRIGIIDVPGHEKFVRTMISGASGIDFVMLVVAADEGIMPQTREHLEICQLLGIKYGFIALTKIDTVDDAWRDFVIDDIRETMQGTFLADAPIVSVSATRGIGLDSIREQMRCLAQKIYNRKQDEHVRLSVDRVFTIKGHGTVVTGTMLSGCLKVGDTAVVLPGNISSRVRSLQQHGTAVDAVTQGNRVAVNLANAEVKHICRGDILTRPGTFTPSERWLVRIHCLAGCTVGIKHRTEIHFHHLAREIEARVFLFDREQIAPGETALAEVRFPAPMVGVFDDTFIIRGASPLRTLAGGKVINPFGMPVRRKEMTPEMMLTLLSLPEAPEPERLLTQIKIVGRAGCLGETLYLLTHMDTARREKILSPFMGKQILCFDRDGGGVLSVEAFNELRKQCLDRIAAYHKAEPLKNGLPREAVFAGWGERLSPKLTHFVLMKLSKSGDIVFDGDVIRLASHNVVLKTEQDERRQALLDVYARAGLAAPSLKDALAEIGYAGNGKDVADLMKLMVESKDLVKVSEGLYCPFADMLALKDKIKNWFLHHDNLDVSALRHITEGLSRKYLIAYLEYFDRERFTLRVGDARRLRQSL